MSTMKAGALTWRMMPSSTPLRSTWELHGFDENGVLVATVDEKGGWELVGPARERHAPDNLTGGDETSEAYGFWYPNGFADIVAAEQAYERNRGPR